MPFLARKCQSQKRCTHSPTHRTQTRHHMLQVWCPSTFLLCIRRMTVLLSVSIAAVSPEAIAPHVNNALLSQKRRQMRKATTLCAKRRHCVSRVSSFESRNAHILNIKYLTSVTECHSRRSLSASSFKHLGLQVSTPILARELAAPIS